MVSQASTNFDARRRAHRQCSRSALLWGLVSFAGVQLGLAGAMECWLPQVRDPEYGYRLARLYPRTVLLTRKPLSVLMLGSSRTTVGFQACQVENQLAEALQRPVVAFNFGITGAGPLMELLDCRRLLEKGIRPDLLLIEVLPPVLAGQLPHAELERVQVSRLWLEELHLLERYGAPADQVRTAWWQAWPVPWYVRRFAILSRLAPAFLPNHLRMDWLYQIDDSGWVAQHFNSSTAERRRLAIERTRLEYAYYLEGFQLGGPACQALQELLALCRDQGIRAALVLMPESADFRGWYSPAAWTAIEDFLHGLSRDYEVPLINARDWIADEDFADAHHLLPHGAALFAERLGREAILPLLRTHLEEVALR